MPTYFADTYALIEYLRGNARFSHYIEGEEWSTSLFNLLELYYAVLRDNGEDAADAAYAGFRRRVAEITDDDVREGMRLRLRQRAKKLDLSYADAIGYAVSVRLKSAFLTGDSAFADLPGVRFVR